MDSIASAVIAGVVALLTTLITIGKSKKQWTKEKNLELLVARKQELRDRGMKVYEIARKLIDDTNSNLTISYSDKTFYEMHAADEVKELVVGFLTYKYRGKKQEFVDDLTTIFKRDTQAIDLQIEEILRVK